MALTKEQIKANQNERERTGNILTEWQEYSAMVQTSIDEANEGRYGI
jgi:hypothetical protein